MDVSQKRNFHLAKEGLYISEENAQTSDKVESERRLRHLDEKLAKMNNPNYKISETRIALTGIDKKIDEAFLKKFALDLLASSLPAKQLNKLKLFRQVKVLYETDDTTKSKVKSSGHRVYRVHRERARKSFHAAHRPAGVLPGPDETEGESADHRVRLCRLEGPKEARRYYPENKERPGAKLQRTYE